MWVTEWEYLSAVSLYEFKIAAGIRLNLNCSVYKSQSIHVLGGKPCVNIPMSRCSIHIIWVNTIGDVSCGLSSVCFNTSTVQRQMFITLVVLNPFGSFIAINKNECMIIMGHRIAHLAINKTKQIRFHPVSWVCDIASK